MPRRSALPKKTLETILKTKNHFLIQVKSNTPKLLKELQQITKDKEPLSTDHTRQRTSGRNDNRLVEVYKVHVDEISADWKGIKRVIKVHRWNDDPKTKNKNRKSKNFNKSKPTNGLHFYIISSPINNATFLAKKIRDHWGIENHLHWVKDMFLKEDQMTIRQYNACAFKAVFNNIAINQIRKAGYNPSKDFFTRITNNVKELIKIIRT